VNKAINVASFWAAVAMMAAAVWNHQWTVPCPAVHARAEEIVAAYRCGAVDGLGDAIAALGGQPSEADLSECEQARAMYRQARERAR